MGTGKVVRRKKQGSREMFSEINSIVPPGINVKLVCKVAPSENLVESGGTSVKAVIVLVATVEIDF